MRRLIHRSLLLLALTVPVLACSDEELGPNGEKVIAVTDDAFDPASKTIAAEDQILWQWKGGHQHNVTWVDTSGAVNSATQTTGTYTRGFRYADRYSYYCTIHGTPTSGMHGTIVVAPTLGKYASAWSSTASPRGSGSPGRSSARPS